MYEVVWQYDENAPFIKTKPATAKDAQELLLNGNSSFAEFFTPHDAGRDAEAKAITRRYVRVSPQDVGLGPRPGEAPPQEPFAAFLSCADARVPVELIFGQQANDLFVVRVAGNVLGDECLGSLDFAVDQLGTVRLLGVLGHTGCGAVTAAVDAYLAPGAYLGVAANLPLQAIVSPLLGPVRGAAAALAGRYGAGVTDLPGYRNALIETAVMLNTALGGAALAHTFQARLGDELAVAFGVYNLSNRVVGLPDSDAAADVWRVGLQPPPTDRAGFEALGERLANSGFIRTILQPD